MSDTTPTPTPTPTPTSVLDVTSTDEASIAPPPRIRWAAIVWGLILAVIAVTVLAFIAEPDRRAAVTDFLWSLDGPTLLLLGLVALGFLMLVSGALTAIHRAQNRRTDTH
jgi:uncharacterized integral membrane protein